MMERKRYFAGGLEITPEEHEAILSGIRPKLIRTPYGQPGMHIAVLSDHIPIEGDRLLASDPLLVKLIQTIGLPLEKTYIIQIFREPVDQIGDSKKAVVFGYW
jgi:hypothetical protein